MYRNYCKKYGAVLADDMGLGKTVQIATFIDGLRNFKAYKRVLVVAPATLLEYWESEINRWCGKMQPFKLDGPKKYRQGNLERLKRMRSVCLISPGILVNEIEALEKMEMTIVVVDEGHKAKNTETKYRKALKRLNITHQMVILTGTPV